MTKLRKIEKLVGGSWEQVLMRGLLRGDVIRAYENDGEMLLVWRMEAQEVTEVLVIVDPSFDGKTWMITAGHISSGLPTTSQLIPEMEDPC